MKLTEIKDIQALTTAQSTTLKGGARDTRGGTGKKVPGGSNI